MIENKYIVLYAYEDARSPKVDNLKSIKYDYEIVVAQDIDDATYIVRNFLLETRCINQYDIKFMHVDPYPDWVSPLIWTKSKIRWERKTGG